MGDGAPATPPDRFRDQYSYLELLAQRPELSNSELAHGAFATRQSMNVLLQDREWEGYVSKLDEVAVGDVFPLC